MVLENNLFSPCPVSAQEAEIVVEIQFICRAANGRPRSLSHLTPEQYKEQKKIALELAEKLTDNFYRALALRHIIALCMAAKDPDAKDLLASRGCVHPAKDRGSLPRAIRGVGSQNRNCMTIVG